MLTVLPSKTNHALDQLMVLAEIGYIPPDVTNSGKMLREKDFMR
jgi:hypothetical protein